MNLGNNPPFQAPDWRTVPYNVTDTFIGGPQQKYLWVAATLSGDGTGTPVISQMRAEYNHASYLEHLPEIYRETHPGDDFLLRFLSLFESFFDEPEAAIAALPLLFDPKAAQASLLPWLQTWLALDLPEDLPEEARRKAIAGGFQSYALRGTPQGLEQAVQAATGVKIMIEEPILHAGWWRLPGPSTSCAAGQPPWTDGENSVLGFTTGLASAAPQGAVAGVTAVLDQSHIISDQQLGAPLFESVANQFAVLVYRSDVECVTKLAQLQAAIEAEKPAHTAYHLCVIQPRMRVGFQARLGVDTVVSGPGRPTPLGDAESAGGLVLAGSPPGLIGEAYVGQDTRL
jgi:phage tail-like protein